MMPPPEPKPDVRAVLFDLDGTLVRTREAAWEVFAETNLEFSLGVSDRKQFYDLFHGNVFDTLSRLCSDEHTAQTAVDHFFSLLRTKYHPLMVPGMSEVVRALAPGCVLGIVSSNALETIRKVTDAAGLSTCIAHVFAGDVVPDKRVAIRKFLEDSDYAALRAVSGAYEEKISRKFDPSEVIFITDTTGDVRHARECGIRAIGVIWGFHEAAELLEAGAEAIAIWPQEIVSLVHPKRASEAIRLTDAFGSAEGQQ
ncbi:MAG: HAD family hydrolase [Janthinobacterium lividum]